MIAAIGFLLIALLVGVAVGGGVGFWLGMGYGKEQTEKKYKPQKEWKKTKAVTYE